MTPFHQSVYDVVRCIPSGKILTYKDIGHILGTRAYRAIGTALKQNPHLIHVPCHRVILSNGSVGGYVKGQAEKVRLLTSEGVKVVHGKIDVKTYRWQKN
ncbi:MAG: MGMT family protein [Candidatus Woesearchaeota archaeon]